MCVYSDALGNSGKQKGGKCFICTCIKKIWKSIMESLVTWGFEVGRGGGWKRYLVLSISE